MDAAAARLASLYQSKSSADDAEFVQTVQQFIESGVLAEKQRSERTTSTTRTKKKKKTAAAKGQTATKEAAAAAAATAALESLRRLLRAAAGDGRSGVVRCLLRVVHDENGEEDEEDEDEGDSAMMRAALGGHVACVVACLEDASENGSGRSAAARERTALAATLDVLLDDLDELAYVRDDDGPSPSFDNLRLLYDTYKDVCDFRTLYSLGLNEWVVTKGDRVLQLIRKLCKEFEGKAHWEDMKLLSRFYHCWNASNREDYCIELIVSMRNVEFVRAAARDALSAGAGSAAPVAPLSVYLEHALVKRSELFIREMFAAADPLDARFGEAVRDFKGKYTAHNLCNWAVGRTNLPLLRFINAHVSDADEHIRGYNPKALEVCQEHHLTRLVPPLLANVIDRSQDSFPKITKLLTEPAAALALHRHYTISTYQPPHIADFAQNILRYALRVLRHARSLLLLRRAHAAFALPVALRVVNALMGVCAAADAEEAATAEAEKLEMGGFRSRYYFGAKEHDPRIQQCAYKYAAMVFRLRQAHKIAAKKPAEPTLLGCFGAAPAAAAPAQLRAAHTRLVSEGLRTPSPAAVAAAQRDEHAAQQAFLERVFRIVFLLKGDTGAEPRLY